MTDDPKILSTTQAAKALGMNYKAFRQFVLRHGHNVGLVRLGAGKPMRVTQDVLERIVAYRAQPGRSAATLIRKATLADAAMPIDTTPAPAKRKPGRPRKGAAE